MAKKVAPKLSVKITGDTELKRGLIALAKKYEEAAAAAVFGEANELKNEVVPLIPVDTGILRSSAYASPPKQIKNPTAKVGVGTKYGIYVHERTELNHKVGQAKFLSAPLTRRQADYVMRMARRIRRNVKGGIKLGGI